MASGENILGIDYGTKRIGLALASQTARLASVWGIIPSTSVEENIDRLKKLIISEDVSVIVLGLPRNLSGEDTPQTKLVREFARHLESSSGIAVHLQDEAGTSARAREEMMTMKNPNSKTTIDSLAAVYILEDYLRELS